MRFSLWGQPSQTPCSPPSFRDLSRRPIVRLSKPFKEPRRPLATTSPHLTLLTSSLRKPRIGYPKTHVLSRPNRHCTALMEPRRSQMEVLAEAARARVGTRRERQAEKRNVLIAISRVTPKRIAGLKGEIRRVRDHIRKGRRKRSQLTLWSPNQRRRFSHSYAPPTTLLSPLNSVSLNLVSALFLIVVPLVTSAPIDRSLKTFGLLMT